MSLLTALLASYDYALQTDQVGVMDEYGDIILPMHHNSMKSDGKNIVRVLIDKNGHFVRSEAVDKDEVIIFPVTEDSVARSSGVAPHPLVDSASYVIQDGEKRSSAYMEQMEDWLAYEDLDFVRIVHDYLKEEGTFQQILGRWMPKPVDEALKLTDPKAWENQEKAYEKELDKLSKVFITFAIQGYDGDRDVSVTENRDLQKRYGAYVKHLNAEDPKREKIVCNLSGKEDYLCIKHRPLMGTARLVSQITANSENYLGRFSRPDQNIQIGTETSEKVHLMAKYLLSGKNTRRWLGEQANMVSWFSDDIRNTSGADISKSLAGSFGGFVQKQLDKGKTKPALTLSDDMTDKIVKSFTNGKILFANDADYYVAIFDKISNGRVAVKYFKQLSVSRLKENLVAWQGHYHWAGLSKENRDKVFTPSPRRMVLAAYGVERDGKLSISKDAFLKTQYQNVLTAIIEGKPVPKNIEKALELNIRNRLHYKTTWPEVKFCALAILKDKGGEKRPMLNRENTDRSYLFGRLLALFEQIEKNTFEKNADRRTNAEKMWTSYTNQPATMMMRLRALISPYEAKLKSSEDKAGIYYKLAKDVSEVTNLLHDHHSLESNEINRPLDYNFIFGYEAQRRDIFTPKETKEKRATNSVEESEERDD